MYKIPSLLLFSEKKIYDLEIVPLLIPFPSHYNHRSAKQLNTKIYDYINNAEKFCNFFFQVFLQF